MTGSLERNHEVCYASLGSCCSASPLYQFIFFFTDFFTPLGCGLTRPGEEGRINAVFVRRAAEPWGFPWRARPVLGGGSPRGPGRAAGANRGAAAQPAVPGPRVGTPGGGGRQPAVPGGVSRRSSRPCPGISPAVARCSQAVALPSLSRPVPARPSPVSGEEMT